MVWALLLALFAAKCIFVRDEAIAEAQHPVQCCFIGLVGVATMVVGGVASPYSSVSAEFLFGTGAAFTLGFAVWRTGRLWQGERDHAATTPVLYLPTVAGGFVMAAVAAGLGYREEGQLAFGGALFSWLGIESVLLHRLYTASTLSLALRPTLGIQLAPPAVGSVAYLGVSGGAPDIVSRALLGYALLQALLLARLLPWIMKQPFATNYWSFTFGATALAAAPMLMIEHGEAGAIARLAPYLFVVANFVVGLVAAGTLRLVAERRLLPQSAPVSLPQSHVA